MPRAYREDLLCPIVEDGLRCGKPVRTRDWCGMHYERWRKHGDPLIVVTPRSRRTHGMTNSPEFSSWDHMKGRCLNPNHHAYADYGGRGITVHGPWIKSFESFYEYMGPMPRPGYSIDRWPDNDGNYEPGNVRWATPLEQVRNRRKKKKCKRGHRLDEENTYVTSAGFRQCRKCRKGAKRRFDENRKADPMRRPKPPTPRSVSATLRAAGFRSYTDDRDDGYGVMWWDDEERTAVYIAFTVGFGDGGAEAVEAADKLHATAIAGMASALRRKGWQVEECGTLAPYLITRGR